MYGLKQLKLTLGDIYYISNGSRIRKGMLIKSTDRGFNFTDMETDERIFKKHFYPMEIQRDKLKTFTFTVPYNLIVDPVVYHKQRQEDIEMRDELIMWTTNKERRKLLYEWVRRGRINYEQFESLLYYIQ